MNADSSELRDPAVAADWADLLLHEAQNALARMDATLTLAEAKVALLRRLRARRGELRITS